MADTTTTRIGLTVPENGVAATTDWGLKLNQNFMDIDEKGVWNDQANTISASTSGALLTLTQGGAGHALLVNGTSSFTARLAVSHATVDDNNAVFSNTSSSGYGLYSKGGSGSRYAAQFNDKDGTQLMLLSGTGNLTIAGEIVLVAQQALKLRQYGYSASYSAIQVGGTGTLNNVALALDPYGISGSSFSGSGQVLMSRKGFLAPNAAGTNWIGGMAWSGDTVVIGPALSSGVTSGPLVVGADSVNISGMTAFEAGLKLTGPATLGAAAAKEWSYEHPITRYYFGDGSGYSFALSKRVGGATTDMLTLTDTGNLSVAGGVVSAANGFQTTAYVSDVRNRIWSFGNADTYGISYFQFSAGYGNADSIGIHFGDATANGSVLNVLSGGGISTNGNVYARLVSGSNSSHRGFKFGVINNGDDFGGVTMEMATGEVRYTAGFAGWGGYHSWHTDGAARMVLNGSHSLLIGRTSNPKGGRLAVEGDAAFHGANLRTTAKYTGLSGVGASGTWVTAVDLSTLQTGSGYFGARVRCMGSENGSVNGSYCEYYLHYSSSYGWTISTVDTKIAVGNDYGNMILRVSGTNLQVQNAAGAAGPGTYYISIDIFEIS